MSVTAMRTITRKNRGRITSFEGNFFIGPHGILLPENGTRIWADWMKEEQGLEVLFLASNNSAIIYRFSNNPHSLEDYLGGADVVPMGMMPKVESRWDYLDGPWLR